MSSTITERPRLKYERVISVKNIKYSKLMLRKSNGKNRIESQKDLNAK